MVFPPEAPQSGQILALTGVFAHRNTAHRSAETPLPPLSRTPSLPIPEPPSGGPVGANPKTNFICQFTVALTGLNNNGICAIQIIRGAAAGSPYDTWAAANAGGQSTDLDFDLDGTPNGIEYFTGETGSSFTLRPPVVNTAGVFTVT